MVRSVAFPEPFSTAARYHCGKRELDRLEHAAWMQAASFPAARPGGKSPGLVNGRGGGVQTAATLLKRALLLGHQNRMDRNQDKGESHGQEPQQATV
jgi:hypothetical protein